MAAPLVGVATLVVGEGGAQAASTHNYQVTFVARSCATYQDISANLARNNIQESLQDLGHDTWYQSGQAIAPDIETPHQPDPPCRPLEGAQFTFGNGINGVTPGTNLSRVSNPGSAITVQPSVPLLDPQGNPTGQSIAAATTVTLTQSQVTAALNRQLWVQGGTPTEPQLSGQAFGALRCAIDNLNGDNVEWVGYPSGTTNVFCYYYAVGQTPAPGTIVINKHLVGATGPQTFQFNGTVSYVPGGDFEVAVPSGQTTGSTSFTRDSNADWTFVERPNVEFPFTSVSCEATNGNGPGVSEFWQDPAAKSTGSFSSSTNDPITVDLAPGDVAACTYTDSPPPPPPSPTLTLFKQTTGNFGGPFHFAVTTPGPGTLNWSATTAAPDTPVEAGTTTGAGVYQITEDLTAADAATPGGHWSVASFTCDGTPGPDPPTSPTQSVTVPVTDTDVECTFVNLFTPDGVISVSKTTTGGVGTTDFSVTPLDPPAGETDAGGPLLRATTTQPGQAVAAHQVAGTTPIDQLPLGSYSISEEGPEDTPAGTWAPGSITCDGSPHDPSASDVIVTVSAATPHVDCSFTNVFTAVTPATTTTTTSTTVVPTPTTTPSGGGDTNGSSTTPVVPALAMTGEDVRLPLGIALVLAVLGLALIGLERVRRPRRPAHGHPDHDRPR